MSAKEDNLCDGTPCAGEHAAECEKLIAELKAAEEEVKNLSEQIARARADFYNYRTRVERDRERDRKLAAEQAVTELLPVLENLERICDSVEKDGKQDSKLHKGISMVADQFMAVLSGLGLERICTEGEFDPNVHEAVLTQSVDDKSKDGLVLSTLMNGYKLAGRVIKAAQVSVGKFTDIK